LETRLPLGGLMPPVPMLSVVIPCYRHAEELGRCLKALAAQDCRLPAEVIVVDSAGDEAVAAAAVAAGVRLITSSERLLPGQARNWGAAHARGDILVFLDADCVPEPDWLGAAYDAVIAGARLAGGPVLNGRPVHPIAVSDNLLQFADFPPSRPNGSARYFPGCNLAIRREDFETVEGFPAITLPSGEDTSFCAAVLARWPGGLRFTRRMRVRHSGRTAFATFLEHQSTFGYCRSALDLHLAPWHRRWGRAPGMGLAITAKRLIYILGRGLQWDRAQLARTLVLLPIVLPGLVAWTAGFRRGLRAGAQDFGR
jgi:glycosyltransferase involved in cell wall biosynthesis